MIRSRTAVLLLVGYRLFGGEGGDMPTLQISPQEQELLDMSIGQAKKQIKLWDDVMGSLKTQFGQPIADEFAQEVHRYIGTLESLQTEQQGTIQNAADLRKQFQQRGQFGIGQPGTTAPQEFLGEESGQEKDLGLLQGRLQSALAGNYAQDPGLERELAKEEQTLNQGLYNQLGSGYNTSSPATQRLNDFALGRAGLRYQVGQQEINRDLPMALNWQNPRLQQILFQGSGLQPSQISTGVPVMNSVMNQAVALPGQVLPTAQLLNSNALAQFGVNSQSALLGQEGGLQSDLLNQEAQIQSQLLNQQAGIQSQLSGQQNQTALWGAGIGAAGRVAGSTLPRVFANNPWLNSSSTTGGTFGDGSNLVGSGGNFIDAASGPGPESFFFG